MMKKFTKIILIIVFIFTLILLHGCRKNNIEKDKTVNGNNEFTIVTSFYPIYIDAINITKDISGVKVISMTKDQTGCLHDYSLTPADLKTLENADVFIVNGAGMEAFINKVISTQKDLKVIDASKGIELIKSQEGDNPHVWVSISNSIAQVKNISMELAKIDTKNSENYEVNAKSYIEKLENLKDEMHEVLDAVPNRDIITFHEAFPYFAKEFNLNIAAVVEREPGSEPTPRELEDTIRIVKEAKVNAIFVEPQYSAKAAETIANETSAKIYTLDPVVTGDGSLDSYINIMKNNLKVLEEALK